jgi:CHAT domain-containing protein
MLVAPLVKTGIVPGDFKRWIIVPHGLLHTIPFAALSPSQGRYLVQDVAVTVTPSASVWAKLQGRPTRAVKSFLGFANPDLPYSKLPGLDEADKEIARIEEALKALRCTVFRGREASEAALQAHAGGKDIVHFATHGEFPEEDVIDFHRVLLSPVPGHNGPVDAEELRRMNFRAARLVVLSICNGGIYRFGPGDEPYGLISALLAAGAENILGTLWPLEDRVGRLFMSGFYKQLLALGPAEALRQACVQFIQDGALLRHWAGFVLVGPGRPLVQ